MYIPHLNKFYLSVFLTVIVGVCSCSENKRNTVDRDSSEATVASETGEDLPLPADVLMITKPLISGQLYTSPSFDSQSVTSFDTSQQIQVLDTAHNIFVRARIRKDTAIMIGYVPKAILPEKK